MRQTRSKTGKLPKQNQPDAEAALKHELAQFSSGSLLSWNARNRSASSGQSRPNQGGCTFLGLPMDILASIFSLAHPADLLVLCRTSYDLREFLSSKGSSSIWTACRKALGVTITPDDVEVMETSTYGYEKIEPGQFDLPPCPSYMNEPAYASLLFGDKCETCSGRASSGSFKRCLNMRICAKCEREKFVNKKQLQKIWKEEPDERIFNILPWDANDRSWRPRPGRIVRPKVNAKVYHIDVCQAIYDRIFDFEMTNNFNARSMTAFFERGEEEIKERLSFAETYLKWQVASLNKGEVTHARYMRDRDAIHQANYLEVIARLNADGIDCVQSDLDDCGRKHLITSARHMTDDEWTQIEVRIREAVVQVIPKRQLLENYYTPVENAKRSRFRPYYRLLTLHADGPFTVSKPSLHDVLALPATQAFMDNPEQPEEFDESSDAWESARPAIIAQCTSFLEGIQDQLLEKIISTAEIESPEGGFTRDDLIDRPDISFICGKCHDRYEEKIRFSQVMTHACNSTRGTETLHATKQRLRSEGLLQPGDLFSGRCNLAALDLTFDKALYEKHQAIYRLTKEAGHEPPKTAQELRQFRGVYKCEKCPTAEFNIGQAILHHGAKVPYGSWNSSLFSQAPPHLEFSFVKLREQPAAYLGGLGPYYDGDEDGPWGPAGAFGDGGDLFAIFSDEMSDEFY